MGVNVMVSSILYVKLNVRCCGLSVVVFAVSVDSALVTPNVYVACPKRC